MKRRATRQLTRQLVESLGQRNISLEVIDNSNLSGAGKHKYIMTLDELLAITGTGGIVNNNLSAQGINDTTTSIMDYGTNVFTTASYTDFATKLPLPYTGKTATIVNSTGFYMVVYPSTVGTTINGVDEFVVIPPDNKAYSFTCIANPLPGAWTWSPPAIGQYEFPEISVNHTTGTATSLITADNVNTSTTYGVGGSTGTIQLLPNSSIWRTLPQNATLVKLKVYTNILDSEIEPVADFAITCNLVKAYKTSDSVGLSTIGWASPISSLDKPNTSHLSLIVNGTNNTPKEVGDTGTIYHVSQGAVSPMANQMLGLGQFSAHYFSMHFYIRATYPTKVYKFKVFLEYV